MDKFNVYLLGQFSFFIKFGKPIWYTSLVIQNVNDTKGVFYLNFYPLWF